MDNELRPRASHRRVSGRVRRRRTILLASLAGLVLIALVVAVAVLSPKAESAAKPSPTPTKTSTPTATASPTPTPTPTPTFDKTRLSIDDPNSIWVVADKLRQLNPADWEPPDLVQVPVPYVNEPYLRQEASDAVVVMFAAAASAGVPMQSQSAYRSYGSQESVYAGWVSSLGQEAADLTSARPGHSEHQTGLSIDISSDPAECALDQCFADTAQGQWLAANAWQYGFTLRYPNGYTAITGYEFEPWHYRYVGLELSTELHTTGIMTLEEFFGLPAAPTYAN